MKTTIEFNGITMTHEHSGDTIYLSYNEHYNSKLYLAGYDVVAGRIRLWPPGTECQNFESCPFNKNIYIECKDDPSKLHKFCEMKYLGLVDNPHYVDVCSMLREMVKKFDGCLVVFGDDAAVLITKTKATRLGCAKVTGDILNHVLVRFDDRRVSDYVGFYKINATSIPDKWIYRRDFDDEVAAMCKQLKDVEP